MVELTFIKTIRTMDCQVGNMSVVYQTLSRFTVFQNLLSDFVSTTEY